MTEESGAHLSEGGADNDVRVVRIYINETGLSVPRGSSILDALRMFDESHARAVDNGESRLVDSRGLDISGATIVNGGTILRVLPVRNRDTSMPEHDQ